MELIYFAGLLICFYLFSLIISGIKKIIIKIRENRECLKIFHDTIPKIKSINIKQYEKQLDQFEELWNNTYSHQKIILKDHSGNIINICPKCGSYMKIVRWYKGPFLGCSNYPDCRSYRNYSDIFKLEI